MERELENARGGLKSYESLCKHKFQEVYDPICHDAYTIPGDPPGTMGVDWRGPCYVPAETIPRWKRTCERCGLIQYTQGFEEEKSLRRKPRW